VTDILYSLRVPPATDARQANGQAPRPLPAGLDLKPGERPVPSRQPNRRYLYGALAAAVALHLFIAASFFFGFSGVNHPDAGAEQGLPDELNVSVISEADLERSSDLLRQNGGKPSPEPAPPSPKPVEETPTPPAPQTADEQGGSPPPLTDESKSKRPYDPSSFIAMASQQFAAQINHAFEAATRREAPRPVAASGNVRMYRPGASRDGRSDAFAQAVYWALAATKPMGNGKWGSTVVTFVITVWGQLEGLRLIHSSGDNWLDQGALMAVRQARLPIPPAGLAQGDRTFNVEYISLEGR
jgi:TonB family protein